MKTLAFFNNKGGVGKTTLTFNVAHMLARLGRRVVLLDYDPQCNLTSIALSESELEEIWEKSDEPGRTVARCVDLVRRGRGDVVAPRLRAVADSLWLLPGDVALSRFEQTLAEGWAKVHSTTDNERALDVATALERLAGSAGEQAEADVVLLDVGPSLGALNRSALLACDAVVIPLAPDLFSLQGLKNTGPTLRQWRKDWRALLKSSPKSISRSLPNHRARVLGYVVQQHLARADRPVAGYQHWARQMPRAFHEHVKGIPKELLELFEDDESCLAQLKHFASLVPMAQAARKPLFDLKPADGAGGGHIQAVAKAREEFTQLAQEIERRMSVA